MARIKVTPEFEILAYPVSAIPRQSSPAWSCADIFGELMSMGQGDTDPTLGEGETSQGTNWKSGDTLAAPVVYGQSNVTFIRFAKNGILREGATSGDKNELSGFVLQGREAFVDARISKPAPLAGSTPLTTGRTVQNWEVDYGKWTTVIPRSEPRRVWLYSSGSASLQQIHTKGELAADRSIGFEIFLTANGAVSGQSPRAVLGIGENAYGLLFRHKKPPVLLKYINGEGVKMKGFEGAPPTTFNGGRVQGSIRLLGGRICVDYAGQKYHFLETSTVNGKADPIDSGWPPGRVGFQVVNAKARFSLSQIKYSESGGTAPVVGSFSRSLKNQAVGVDPADAGSLGGHGRGWNRFGTAVDIAGAQSGTDLNYTATMTASDDGVHTPLVSGAMLKFAPDWISGDPSPINITLAVLRGTVSQAMPPVAPGAQATLEIDLQALKKLNPRWASYTKKYCPVSIRQRWKYNDGTRDEWTRMLRGYFVVPEFSLGLANEARVTWTCHDPILRLQGNNARIRKSAPLDIVFYEKANNGGDPNLYGYDCVQEIIDSTIGREVGGTVFSVFPPDHYPLLSISNDASGGWMFLQPIIQNIFGHPPTLSTWQLPPPFGDDAIAWIQRICKLDNAVFYYGWPNGDTSAWPSPIYGRLQEILRNRSLRVLPDDAYLPIDANNVLLAVELSSKIESDINEVWAMGSPPPEPLRDFFPALPSTIAVAKLPASDPNSAERSWSRVYFHRSDLSNLSRPEDNVSQYLAQGIINELKDVNMVFPDFHIRGDATFQWGDRVAPKMIYTVLGLDGAKVDLGINGQEFRIERVNHDFIPNVEFNTKLGCYPVSATGA